MARDGVVNCFDTVTTICMKGVKIGYDESNGRDAR